MGRQDGLNQVETTWFRDGIGRSYHLRVPFTGPCVIEHQCLDYRLHIACTLEEGYCDLVPGFGHELVQFHVMGRPEAVQCVEKFWVSRGLGFSMIPQYGDDLWFSPRRRKVGVVSALLLSSKGAEELPDSRMH